MGIVPQEVFARKAAQVALALKLLRAAGLEDEFDIVEIADDGSALLEALEMLAERHRKDSHHTVGSPRAKPTEAETEAEEYRDYVVELQFPVAARSEREAALVGEGWFQDPESHWFLRIYPADALCTPVGEGVLLDTEQLKEAVAQAPVEG